MRIFINSNCYGNIILESVTRKSSLSESKQTRRRSIMVGKRWRTPVVEFAAAGILPIIFRCIEFGRAPQEGSIVCN